MLFSRNTAYFLQSVDVYLFRLFLPEIPFIFKSQWMLFPEMQFNVQSHRTIFSDYFPETQATDVIFPKYQLFSESVDANSQPVLW